MGKEFMESAIPLALGVGAMALTGGAAAPALAGGAGGAAGAGAAGAAGAGAATGAATSAGALGAGEAAGTGLLSGGAFGSADMLAQAVPGAGLLGSGATEAALPALMSSEAPIPYGQNMATMADGSVGMTLEGSGMTPNSFTGGYDRLNGLQRLGQRFTSGLDSMNFNPSNLMRGQPQQQQVSRSPAVQRPQSQPSTEVAPLYGQQGQRQEMSPQELQQRLMLMRMTGRG